MTRAKSNSVAFEQFIDDGKIKRGRKRIYGDKIKLKSLFEQKTGWEEAGSPTYGDKDVAIRYLTKDLLWRPVGQVVRFVLVQNSKRGCCVNRSVFDRY